MKKLLVLVLTLAVAVYCTGCACIPLLDNSKSKAQEFYNTVSEAQDLLDTVADDIYSNWHDAIYEDEFDGDIDTAIFQAQFDNVDNLNRIEELDLEIASLFKDVKDSEYGDKVKEVMTAYSDYYEFVVNVSGSFNSYSAEKEPLKKALASSLKELSYEL